MTIRYATALLLLIALGSAGATELVYVPKNPSFGGNPLNGTTFINEAQLQNKHDTDPSTQKSQLQQFNDNLQRVILSRLASSISGGLFDSNGKLVPGTLDTTDFSIAITSLGGNQLQITTTDKSTGQQTSFQVSQ
ncbi:hypothetical protein PTE30175_03020 [Pandoraea terrae]|uniref:Curli production assembly/transport component CsgF n=1 Tax=Pandoraea terrae TaxID=1537710 RepID=A0A5E4W6W1_9BURK|nr:curli assembly protein CsgF [Pandoraea terrae]VVE20358.1 hypothetical protein PTE30175_03020 [Pandoraea terrae]